MQPKCNKCGVELTDANWYPSYQRSRTYRCKPCDSRKNAANRRLRKIAMKRGERSLPPLKPCCRVCAVKLTEKNTYFSARLDGRAICKKCEIERSKGYFDSSRHAEAGAKSQRKLRETVIEMYGGECACCGERRYEFLAMHHVHGGGAEHRKASSNNHYRDMRDDYRTDLYEVMCHNCNASIGYYGYCPHKKKSQEQIDASSRVI